MGPLIKSISDLPVELKLIVLMSLDGPSLTRMRSVSKEWKNILDNPNFALSKKWADICKREIDQDVLRSIMISFDPKYYINFDLHFFKLIYKNCNQWHKFPEWVQSKSLLFSTSNCEVACSTISGNWLFVGTRNYGSLMAFNCSTKSVKTFYRGGNISDIQPYTISEDHSMFIDLAHDKLVLQFENLSRAELNLHNLNINIYEELSGRRQLHYLEGKKVQVEIDNHQSEITLWKPGLEARRINLSGLWSIEHIWPNGSLLLEGLEGYYLVVDDNLKINVSHPFCFLAMSHFKKITLIYYYGESVIISVNKGEYGIKHEMIVRVQSTYQSYFPFCEGSFHVTSAIYHGMMLFLGTDLGNINVYRTKNIFDLAKLDLSIPYSILEIGRDAIISITIKETEDKPIIWAASAYDVYQISFL